MRATLAMSAVILFLLSSLAVAADEGGAEAAALKEYDDVVLYDWWSTNMDETWDLTKGDLVLEYTLDMSTIASAGWSVVEVGIREKGCGNLDPNMKGGWMQSNYIFGTSNPGSLSINDMHRLACHGWLLPQYDATGSETFTNPYWSGNNYGFWFDRDGVDQWQANMWGMVDGGTYNTGGVYDMVITYHAVSEVKGTMFATINGVQQGLYTSGYKNAEPEFYPAGKSFYGDMSAMQVFMGRGGGGGHVTISDITVTGELAIPTIPEAMGFIDDNVDGKGMAKSLTSKLASAYAKFLDGKEDTADNILGAFVNSVEAQKGKHIPADVAEKLIEWANAWMCDAALAV